MIHNYIKIAWRSLRKQPFFTLLNIFGLAIGMAGALMIGLYIHHELSYDKMFKDSERIYRVNSDIKFGGEAQLFAEATAPMAAVLEEDFPQIEMATRIRNWGSILIRPQGEPQNAKEDHTAFADADFFEMFGVELLIGDSQTALQEPNTLIMTRKAVEKHFPVEEALGKVFTLDNNDSYTLTGVVEDFPTNSMFRDHTLLLSMKSHEDAWIQNWSSNNYFTFFKLKPGIEVQSIAEPLQALFGKYVIPGVQEYFPGITEEQFLASGNYLNYSAIPLTDIHLHSNRFTELSANNDIQNVYILSFIGLFLLVLASVNFMNLSTASSLKRAREVGIRKTLGSSNKRLIFQFLTESLIVTFASLILALFIAFIVLPYFNELSGKVLELPVKSLTFWILVLILALVLGIFSGSYPAFFMTRFLPVKVLKGQGNSKTGGTNIRNTLVVFQFAISVFLIVSTLVVFQQLKYIQTKDLGYSKEQLLVINDVYTIGTSTQTFKNEVLDLAQVESATLSSYYPTPSNRTDSSFFEEGRFSQEEAVQLQTWRVDTDYINTLGADLLAGRDFDPSNLTDSTAVILNESALKTMGKNPEEVLGLRITTDLEEEEPVYYTVIGVVKNFHYASFRDEIGALGLILGDFANAMAVKLRVGNIEHSIDEIRSIWENIAPGQPFNFYFMDESFNTTYDSEQRLGRIFVIFTILSIAIACLGLFGLAAFNAEKRTKEIGIRKVMGASVGQITYKLAVDFLKLVVLSILISIPLGWYAMQQWLQDFTYRIDIPWWVFIMAALLAVGISIVTVSYQSIKAAIVNPVRSLRSE